MKKLFLLAVTAMLAFGCSSDDSAPVTNPNPIEAECNNVYKGNIHLATQEEVDAFAMGGYCRIKGSLIIGPKIIDNGVEGEWEFIESTITDLSGLEGLRIIDEAVEINRNTLLISLQGLHNVKSAERLFIENNKLLTSLEGLNSFEDLIESEMRGSLGVLINNNESLLSLQGLGSLRNAYSIGINGNTNLISLSGLESIQTLQYFTLTGSHKLTSLTGLDNLKECEVINIHQNSNLQSILSLASLTSCEYISLSDTKLTSLSGLENITNLTGSIWIYLNSYLSDFCAISNIINSAGNIDIHSNLYNPTKEDILAGNCSQ